MLTSLFCWVCQILGTHENANFSVHKKAPLTKPKEKKKNGKHFQGPIFIIYKESV